MRGYGETPPPGLFDRIESTLAKAETPRRKTPVKGFAGRMVKYASVAAVLAAAFLTVLYFKSRNSEPAAPQTAENTAPPDILPASEEHATIATDEAYRTVPDDQIAQSLNRRSESLHPSSRQTGKTCAEFFTPVSGKEESETEITRSAISGAIACYGSPRKKETAPSIEPIIINPDAVDEGGSVGKEVQEYWDRLIAQEDRTHRSHRGARISGSVYAGNFGATKGNLHSDDPDMAASAGMLVKQTADRGGSLHSGLQEDNGKPVLAPGQPVTQAVDLNHRMPVNAGLTLAIPLNDKLSIRTGLSYSYLYSSSDQAFTAGNVSITRELHYIGIPLSLSYTFFRAGNVDFYIQGGGMAEKAVAWRETKSFTTSEDTAKESTLLKVRGIQFSVNATAGIGYDFNRHIGLYIEPGITYYFAQKNQPANYRTVHPASFAIRIGLKFGI